MIYSNPTNELRELFGAAENLRVQLHSKAGKQALAGIYLAISEIAANLAEATAVPTHMNVVLVSTGEKKINVIKLIREWGKMNKAVASGLADVKALADAANDGNAQVVMAALTYEEAHHAKQELESQGATVKLEGV